MRLSSNPPLQDAVAHGPSTYSHESEEEHTTQCPAQPFCLCQNLPATQLPQLDPRELCAVLFLSFEALRYRAIDKSYSHINTSLSTACVNSAPCSRFLDRQTYVCQQIIVRFLLDYLLQFTAKSVRAEVRAVFLFPNQLASSPALHIPFLNEINGRGWKCREKAMGSIGVP